MRNIKLKAAIIVVMLSAISVRAADLIVDGPGGSHYATIQAAVDAAGSGDTILLEAGMTFTGEGNRNVSLSSKDLIFDRHGEGADPLIDLESEGRLFDIFNYSIEIHNLVIKNGYKDNGGAVFIGGRAVLTATNCTFEYNTGSSEGGAVYIEYLYAFETYHGTFHASNCTFYGNKTENTGSDTSGGAIYNDGTLDITSCTFEGNNSDASDAGTSAYGGAINNASESVSCTIRYSRFVNNTAKTAGNAIYAETAVDAEYNWWGSNSPIYANLFAGTAAVDYEPYMTVSLYATHPLTGASTVSASFIGTGYAQMPDTPVAFTSTDGVVTPTQTMIVDGIATASFVASNTTAIVCAQVDDQSDLCTYAGSLIVNLVGPYTNIQAAVDDAVDGDTIYITAGQTFQGAGNYDVNLRGLNLSFDRIGTGDDPIIDLNSQGKLFEVMSTQTIAMSNLLIREGLDSFGGAINNNGSLYITNCAFRANRSTTAGGAIYNYNGSLYATDSTFDANTTSAFEGGAIYNENGSLTITSCTFNGNVSPSSGGAIYNDNGSVDATDSTFDANTTSVDGGAIDNEDGSLTITSCTFNGNISSSNGGAIYNGYGGSFNVMYSTFDANSANSRGGALCNDNLSSSLSRNIKCCRIIQNSASSGSALYSDGVVIARYNWWGTNSDPKTIPNLIAGAIAVTSNFEPWIQMSLYSSSQAIGEPVIVTASFTKDGTCTIPDTTITFTATDGIVTPTQTMVLDGIATATFVASNEASSVCAQVDDQSECLYAGALIVDLSGTYTNIQAAVDVAYDGLTIYLTAGQTFTGAGNYNVDLRGLNLTFDRYGAGANPIVDLESHGRLFDVTSAVTMNNLVVKNGSADEGGAIYNDASGNLTVTNCTFIGNRANYGGVFYNRGILNVSTSTLDGNSADNVVSPRGGAIYSNSGTLTIETCTLTNNNATSSGAGATYGGACYIEGTSGAVSCSRIVGNIASQGSAIYSLTFDVLATNNWWGTNDPTAISGLNYGITYIPCIQLSLSSSHPLTGDPLLIASFSNNDTCTIPDTPITFTTTDGIITPTQKMLVNGQAIVTLSVLTEPATACASVDDEDECVTYKGLLIVDINGTYTNIQDAVNDAADGDIIYLTAGQTFTGAGNRGIYLNSRILTFDRIGTGPDPIVDLESTDRLFYIQGSSIISINNMVIKNGKAADTGGVIYQNGGTLNATNCSFIDNEAPNSGGAFYSVAGNFNFTYCTFDGNSATGTFATGGAIYKGLGNLYSCIIRCSRFINNTAIYRGNAIESNGNITATNNWWGTNNPDFNSLIYMNYGTVTYDPWIQMSLSSSHPPIGDPAIVTASFTKDGTCTIPDVPITFTATDGIVTPTQTMVIDGEASTTFITSNTMAEVCAQVDDEVECIRYQGELIVDLYGTYTNIQAAVNAATGEETIYITAGQTFTGLGNYNVDLRGLNITFDRTGTGEDPIIDLESHGRLFEIMSTQTINMSNLVVENGLVNDNGGAIKNSGFLTIANCTFDSNITETATAFVPSNGGAIYSDGTLTVTTCIFRENISRATSVNGIAYGGAVYSDGDLTLSDCMFIGNYSDADTTAYGGALYTGDNCYAFGCTFSGSTALSGGAIINAGGSLTLTDCILSSNTVNRDGGAISNSGPLNISRCTFSGNSAGLNGGAIWLSGNYSITIEDSTFSGNSADIEGGVIYNTNSSNLTIGTCTFLGNSADTGGVVYNDNFGTVVCSCSRFVHNTASTGSAIAVFAGTVTATNNWWGTNTPAASLFYGTVTYDPWMVVSLSTDPAIVAPGSTSLLLTNFKYNSDEQEITACSIPATPVGFSTTDGSITSPLENTVDGIATTTLITNYSGLSFTVSATVGPDDEMYSLDLTVTPDPIIPGISIIKRINGSAASTAAPGVVVSPDRMMDISYIITNTGNVTLNIAVTDDQGYEITPSTTTLMPDASITCTTQGYAPSLNELHHNIGIAEGTTALSAVVTASASAYATSIPVNPYRYNFGCICSDEGDDHILIGSHNMPSLDGNSLDFWMFNETPTVSFIGSLNLGQQIIMDSATYNTEDGMNIAVLTQTQEGNTALVLVTYDGTSAIARSTTTLTSQAFKAQWAVSSNGTPYIVADTQDGMSLYEVDLNSYTVTIRSSVPNLGAGAPSVFLRWYPQGNSLYVIQGYNQTSVATYKVNLTTGIIEAGVSTDLTGIFATINSCATCYENLVLGGGSPGEESLLTRCTVEDGDLQITQSASIFDVSEIFYCERCCCDNNPILVGTDNGLYSLDADTLDVVASNTLMSNNVWINTCWCCDITGDYCLAVNSDHETYVFQQTDTTLNQVLQL